MSKPRNVDGSDMRAEYDFESGVRGLYAGRVRKGGMVVVLDPDVANLFPDSRAVNRALRALADIVRRIARDRRGS